MQDPSTSITGTDHRTQWLSTFSLRLTGYVLLALSALNFAAVVIPTDFFNPEWEFKTIGSLVEQVPVPLIGLALVFYGGLRYRRPLEKLFLRPLALLAILFGVLYLLLIPLGISDSIRLTNVYNVQATQQSEQQQERFKALEQQITNAPPEQVTDVVSRMGLSLTKDGKNDPEALRTKALSQLNQNRIGQDKQNQTKRRIQKRQHLKNSLKWIVGAMLAGVCLIYLGMGANKFFLLGLK